MGISQGKRQPLSRSFHFKTRVSISNLRVTGQQALGFQQVCQSTALPCTPFMPPLLAAASGRGLSRAKRAKSLEGCSPWGRAVG